MATATATERLTESIRWPTREAVEENLRQARRVITTVRHTAEDAAAEAARTVNRHPFLAFAGAAVVAGFAGILVGFGAGWCARARR